MKDLRDIIKPCMVVKLRNGDVYMVHQVTNNLCFVRDDRRWCSFNVYDYELKCYCAYDVMEVYGFVVWEFRANDISTEDRPLIWKREEKLET